MSGSGRTPLAVVGAIVAVPVVVLVLLPMIVTPMAAGMRLDLGGGSAGAALNTSSVPAQYVDALVAAGQRCAGVSAPLLAAQIQVESAWNPAAVSRVGAAGLAQFMPTTWTTWGKDYSGDGVADPFDPLDAIGSQADYMCHLHSLVVSALALGTITGDPVQLTLASYNAGPGNVKSAGGIPPFPETQSYVSRILAELPRFTQAPAAVDPGAGPPVSRDGTYRVPMNGSGRLDTSILCPLPWSDPDLRLRCDAAQALGDLSAAYEARFGTSLCVGDAYRDYAAQVATKASKGHLAAEPGTSNHGWGLAVDLCGIGGEGSRNHSWLRQAAPSFGWDHPSWARLGGSKPESWHWEFVGS